MITCSSRVCSSGRKMPGVPGAEGLTTQGLQILEQGATKFPQSVAILEHLAGFYIRLPGCEQQLEKTLLQIEKLAPDSSMLEAMNSEEEEGRSAKLANGCARAAMS